MLFVSINARIGNRDRILEQSDLHYEQVLTFAQKNRYHQVCLAASHGQGCPHARSTLPQTLRRMILNMSLGDVMRPNRQLDKGVLRPLMAAIADRG